MIKWLIEILKKTSWFSLLLAVVWLVVLGVIAQRYFKVRHTITISASDKSTTNNITHLKNRDLIDDKDNLTSDLWDDSAFNVDGANLKQVNLLNQILYTSLGEVHAIYDASSKRFTLYLNQVPIQLINTPLVNYAFQLSERQVVLVFAGEKVGHDYVYTLIDLNNGNGRIIYDVGNFERLIDAELKPDKKCIHLRFEDSRKYAESGGYQIYQYCGTGNLAKVIDNKPESYYISKFAKISAEEIYQQALNDGCFNLDSNEFYLKRSCSYGVKYCKQFHGMVNPVHDKYYDIISMACQKKDSMPIYSSHAIEYK